MAVSPDLTDRVKALARLDFRPAHRPPSIRWVVLATLVSIGAALLADAALVAIATRVFPSTEGYVHFAFGDYARLTVIGIVVACAAWPVVVRVSSAPRWLFLRLAVAVTLVLLVPDLYLLVKGQPLKAVVVLMAMHLVIAVVTYFLVTRLAPARTRAAAS
jgi:hypothetical protein